MFGTIVSICETVQPVAGGDWPQWRYDAGHTAASPDSLPATLNLHWTCQYAPRQQVWDDPLNQDMMQYDRLYEPVVAKDRMFLSFNDSDKVVALNVQDGTELWAFYADGPVRFPPVIFEDSVLFVSDDGYLYCVAAADGALRWRFLGGPSERKVLGNRRVICSWPARGGPAVVDNTVYFAASIWPFMGTFIYALDARTGQIQWRNESTGDEYQKQPHAAPAFAGVAPQGQLTVAGDLLLVPGGRSLPAGFDRQSGTLKFFNFGAKGQGGCFVAADARRAFVHTRVNGTMALTLPAGSDAKFQVNEPVLAGDVLYAAAEATTKPTARGPRITAYDQQNKLLWEVDADGRGDLIAAGDRLYAAGGKAISAIDLPRGDAPARVAWTRSVDGEVCRLVAAASRLFAVTLDGRILAFGEDRVEPQKRAFPQVAPPSADVAPEVAQLIETVGAREGYVLWFGLDDERLLAAVAASSELHIVGVDPDAQKIDRLRRRIDQIGWYGKRIALETGTLDTYLAPPYLANVIIVGRSLAPSLRDAKRLARVFESVRPYGGKLWIQTGGAAGDLGPADLATAELTQAEVATLDGAVVLTRPGPLPGAGQWTHAYGDIGNTVKSDDQWVKLPLGLLWFGGSSHDDVLPRHGHGPSPQVLGGRLFIEGVNCLSARDVYTGRLLWRREFENLGTYDVYYDESYADTPLDVSYNQLHLPGANQRGTNFVVTEDGVYLAIGSQCLLLDAATGRTVREFVMPPDADGKSPEWGYIGVYGDLLLGGAGFGDFEQRYGYSYVPAARRGRAWAPDHSASRGLVAFDRHRGDVAWRLDAQYSFLHNGIVAGGGRIYLLDKLPQRVEEVYRRRGVDAPAARLLTIEATTGAPLWKRDENVFGTWLSYSQPRDLLVQAGSAASDRSLDEAKQGLTVHRAADGAVVWSNPTLTYAGPCILHGDTLITNTTSYKENEGAFSLLDGSPITVPDPVTGQQVPWRFTRTYGCNTAIACEHLLTFRSGAAGFYDLTNHGGTGNFGGFKSGCTSNLIAADGVLNAPDYTRTCQCAYQNQASLALIHMPDNEVWTTGLFGRPPAGEPRSRVRRIGINFGAPGDRLADNGTWWVNYPPDDGASPDVPLTLDDTVRWFRKHSSRVSGDGLAWVAASGGEDIRKLVVHLKPAADEPEDAIVVQIAESGDDAEESATGAVSLTSSDLELVQDKTMQTVGLRFPNVPLARGAKVARAYVQFDAKEATDQPTQLEIRGHAADNAAAFATAAFNISQRPTTKADVSWEPKAWKKGGKPGPDQRTPDLSAVIQEVVDRPAWQQGNALALIIRGSGKRVAISADGDPKRAPKLVLELEKPTTNLADDAASTRDSSATRRYSVRLHFLEPDSGVQPGQRVFDVALQGRKVLAALDVAAAAGGPWRTLERAFDGIVAEDSITLALDPRGNLPPVLSGIEIIEQPR